MRTDARDILRRFCIERWLRLWPKAQDIEGEPAAEPRMSQTAWAEACSLTRGVDERAIRLLTRMHVDRAGEEWRPQTVVDLASGEFLTVMQPFAKPLTVAQAAKREGIDPAEAKALIAEAVEVVTDNLLRRVRRAA